MSESSSEGVCPVRDPYWYTLFSENVSDPVVETFGDTWDVQVRPFCVERSRVFLMVLGLLSFVYSAFSIPVKTEGVVKHVLMLCGCRFCAANWRTIKELTFL